MRPSRIIVGEVRQEERLDRLIVSAAADSAMTGSRSAPCATRSKSSSGSRYRSTISSCALTSTPVNRCSAVRTALFMGNM